MQKVDIRKSLNYKIFMYLLAIFILSRLMMVIMVLVYNSIMGTNHSFAYLMNPWDAKRYQFIIENGYTYPLDTDPQANWAFFPLYVIVCQLVQLLTFWKLDTFWVGMIVSNICIFVGAFFGLKYIFNRNNNDLYNEYSSAQVHNISDSDYISKNTIIWGSLLFAAPYMFYCSSTYTEAMFIMFIALFFYFCQQKKYVVAGIMSAAASATRIVGCMLVFALIVELYLDFVKSKAISSTKFTFASKSILKSSSSSALKSRDTASSKLPFYEIKKFLYQIFTTPKHLIAILLCPLGTFLYMTFLRFFCGDVFAFKHVQIAWREDSYIPVIGVLWKACTGQIEPRYTYMGWFCIGVFVVYGYMIYRKYYSMAVFGIVSLLIPLTSHVMSTCRFTVGSYVFLVGIYNLINKIKNKFLICIIIMTLALIELYLLFLWYNSDCWLM